ncbi:hypothetical protein WG8_3114 [Paenibacillus sp. Aloe-11]|nr:hypothetical protein WG8_3114 [Paenibacillus sp. Aloe-11]
MDNSGILHLHPLEVKRPSMASMSARIWIMTKAASQSLAAKA